MSDSTDTASSAEVRAQLISYGVGLGGFALILAFVFWRNHVHVAAIARHAPRIEAALPRADEALETALRGTATCDVCGFANFAHVQLCVQCGDAVGDEATRKKTRRRRKKAPQRPASALRAARVRRNGEWARKVDIWGRVYWFRAPVPGLTPLHEAYTIRLHTELNTSTYHVGSTTIPGLNVEFVSTSATHVDAIVFPVGPDLLNAAMRVIPLTSEPFPVRYAEFVQRASALVPSRGFLRFRLKDATKQAVFSQAMTQLLTLTSTAGVRSQLMIRLDTGSAFAGTTESVDWHRDWFATLGEVLGDESTGLFTCANLVEQSYMVNADSRAVLGERHLDFFFATGRLLGNALLHGDLLAFHLAPPLLKILLGQPLSVADLQDVDPVVFKSLTSLLE